MKKEKPLGWAEWRGRPLIQGNIFHPKRKNNGERGYTVHALRRKGNSPSVVFHFSMMRQEVQGNDGEWEEEERRGTEKQAWIKALFQLPMQKGVLHQSLTSVLQLGPPCRLPA